MAVKNLNLPNFPTFDLGETDTISPRWKKYKQRFELLCTAVGVNEEKQKLAMFLTYVGDETFEVYENIKPNDAPTYKETIEAFDKHFMPLTNKSYETFLFRNLKQDEGENLNEFYIRLKEQAAKMWICRYRPEHQTTNRTHDNLKQTQDVQLSKPRENATRTSHDR